MPFPMRLRVAAALAACAATAPAYAEPLDSCTAFAVPPRQDGRAARADGGVSCGGTPRASVTVEVCVDAFAYFAGWMTLGCGQTTSTGSVSLALASVTVCPDPDFPLMRTRTEAWTDRGESASDASVLSTAACPR